jgi:hypothetical protein
LCWRLASFAADLLVTNRRVVFVWSGVAIAIAISIVEASRAEYAPYLFTQSLRNERSVAFTASDAADVRRIDIELYGYPFVDAAKNGERCERRRGIIGLVTIHDFL